MQIRKAEYPDVQQRAAELKVNAPTGLALLPRNFADAVSADDLIHESTAPTVRVLWKEAGVDETQLEPDGVRIPTVSENAFEWLGPTIFIGAAIWSENPQAVTIALGVISNYLTEWFKGIPGDKRVRMSAVVEKTKSKGKSKTYVKVEYEGPPEQVADLADMIKEAADE